MGLSKHKNKNPWVALEKSLLLFKTKLFYIKNVNETFFTTPPQYYFDHCIKLVGSKIKKKIQKNVWGGQNLKKNLAKFYLLVVSSIGSLEKIMIFCAYTKVFLHKNHIFVQKITTFFSLFPIAQKCGKYGESVKNASKGQPWYIHWLFIILFFIFSNRPRRLTFGNSCSLLWPRPTSAVSFSVSSVLVPSVSSSVSANPGIGRIVGEVLQLDQRESDSDQVWSTVF